MIEIVEDPKPRSLYFFKKKDFRATRTSAIGKLKDGQTVFESVTTGYDGDVIARSRYTVDMDGPGAHGKVHLLPDPPKPKTRKRRAR